MCRMCALISDDNVPRTVDAELSCDVLHVLRFLVAAC